MKYDIKDINLASKGAGIIDWAGSFMPVLSLIKKRFEKEKPLKNLKIAACLHVTAETANLAVTLKDAGAEVFLCASNPLSTKDDVAASLVYDHSISVFAIHGEDKKSYYNHINSVLDIKPDITIDDGADLVATIHKERKNLVKKILGGTEETTTGVIRLKSLAANKKLLYPIIAVNDSYTKHLFDNRYGTGQSTIDGILRATNILIAGVNFVVCGYGWCGKGVSMRAKGMGAKVIVCEANPLRALEATMDGFQVMPLMEAAKKGKIFVTVTGDISVIEDKHFKLMQDGAIVCNSGHFDAEINKKDLERISLKKKHLRTNIEQYILKDGRKINLLSEGRLVNLASAEGHPASVMDMSFANQALACEYIRKNNRKMKNEVYKIPDAIDSNIAELKLQSMNIQIDRLTEFQKKYLTSWQAGT